MIILIAYLVISFIFIFLFKKSKEEINTKKIKRLSLLFIFVFIFGFLFYFSCENRKEVTVPFESKDLTISQTLDILDLSNPGALIETKDGNVFILYSWEQSRFLTVYRDGELSHFNLNDDTGLRFLDRIKNITNKTHSSYNRKSELANY